MLVFRLLSAVALLGACTPVTPHQLQLYEQYARYGKTVNAINIKSHYQAFFTPSLLEGESLDDPEVVSHLLFPRLMPVQSDHFEKIEGTKGCLTINGVSGHSEPMTFSLEYIGTRNGWLIDEILVAFFEASADQPSRAVCPNELRRRHL
jgi:hypothetical protein